MLRKYILVDLFSGSYHEAYTGHEILNDQKNSITGKYYGYLPPLDDPNILKLGASRSDSYIDNITVIFVQKYSQDSTDRRVTGFYPKARIYREKQDGEALARYFRNKEGLIKTASYSMESDTYHPVLSNATFIIETRKYNPYMFRRQRVYAGKYPELDLVLNAYLERLMIGEILEDSNLAQQELQEISGASDQIIRKAPNRELLFEHTVSGKRVLRNPQIAKAAIIAADYKCEVDPQHTTFFNSQGKPYMEGHHLIPCTVENAEKIWEAFDKNIDCLENIVSLCPTCHRAVHMGSTDEKRRLLLNLMSKRLLVLKKLGINMSKEDLLGFYQLK